MQLPFSELDYTLLLGCINRNRDSQKRLYNLLSPSIYSSILQDGYKQKEAEEILERVFVEIFNSIQNYNRSLSFRSWYLEIYSDTVSVISKDVTNKTNEMSFE